MRSTELQNKYKAEKKIAHRYKVWAHGKEQHLTKEWERIMLGFKDAFDALEVVQAKVQAALADADRDSADTERLKERMQALQDTMVRSTPS
jgi:hypothetical protein